MASYLKRGGSWRASIYKAGVRETGTFPSKAKAVAWATQREAELVGARLPEHTVGAALRKYSEEVSPLKKGERWEVLRLAVMQQDPLAGVRMPAVTATDIQEWRDRRMKLVAGASVRREMNLLQSVFTVARTEWRWIRASPMDGVKRPASPPARRRRVTDAEIERVCQALGYTWPTDPQNLSHRVALAFLLAIETGMRAGELMGLSAATINLHGRYVDLPLTKNGDARQVPLSAKAARILTMLPNGFELDPGTRDTLFRRARDAAQIPDLHFHDARSEAVWRLSKKLDVLQLARVIGHRDIRSLQLYYNESASDLAKRLD